MEEKTIIRCEQNQMKTYDYNTDVARSGGDDFCSICALRSSIFGEYIIRGKGENLIICHNLSYDFIYVICRRIMLKLL